MVGKSKRVALELSSENKKPGGRCRRLESKGQEAGIGGQEPGHEGSLGGQAEHYYNCHGRVEARD